MVNAQNIIDYVDKTFTGFGPNKRQEVSRLLYEISKREQKDFQSVLADTPQKKFSDIKEYLIKRRYPRTTSDSKQSRYMISKLDIDSSLRVDLDQKPRLIPQHFVIEEDVKNYALIDRLKKKFPDARFEWTPSYKEYHGKKKFTSQDYNNRLETYYITKEKYDFFKRCACSPKSVYCGYHVVNLGSGCGFECAYCYLQDYINSPGIVLPANIEDFFTEFENYKQDVRLGSGELTDSLIFDHITEFSPRIVEFFKKYPGSTFEFKTKSNNIKNLLTVKPGNNIVISWTMNPQKIVDLAEHHTASLEERLRAGEKCVDAGYKVGFHFDPMIHFSGWEEAYHDLVSQVYDRIDKKRIAWLSVGGLRMTPRLKKIIENRFPETKILDEEFVPSYDGKLRYTFDIRTKMFTKMKEWIKEHDQETFLYLCMEEKDACGTCETAPLKKFS